MRRPKKDRQKNITKKTIPEATPDAASPPSEPSQANDQLHLVPPHEEKPSGSRSDELPDVTEKHRRAVVAIQQMFRLWPVAAARWILQAVHVENETFEVYDGRFIEQARRGPSYIVPPSRNEKKKDVPTSPEEMIGQVIKDAITRDAEKSKGKPEIRVVDFDFAEAQRQSLAKGGADVELWLRASFGNSKPMEMLLGVRPAMEHDDGAEMSWAVLNDAVWQMIAYERLVRNEEDKYKPYIMTVPLYLWPGTGLLDPQENCSVLKDQLEIPGILGALIQAADTAEQRQRSRKDNIERLERHRRLDQRRREAAARRKALMGDAGITDEQLASLMPDIDIDIDRITMIHHYNIIRLWEEPFDTLLDSLHPGCLGLALFGYRPSKVSAEHALERCAFKLRSHVQREQALDAQQAALSLAALGSVFVESADVERLLSRMKLL